VLALDAEDAGIENEDALDHILQFADIAGPVILTERFEGFVANLNARTAGETSTRRVMSNLAAILRGGGDRASC
jgi:hypothetical protein